MSQDFGENKYSKNIKLTIQNKIIVSQDFGENKYSKNVKVTIRTKICHKTLERISTSKISMEACNII